MLQVVTEPVRVEKEGVSVCHFYALWALTTSTIDTGLTRDFLQSSRSEAWMFFLFFENHLLMTICAVQQYAVCNPAPLVAP